MAESFASAVRAQLGAEAIRDVVKKGIQEFTSIATGELGKEAREKIVRDLLGNPEHDEQIYKVARARALEKNYMTWMEMAAHMHAIQHWPRGRQNAYRRFVIQSWREDPKKGNFEPETIIEETAKVIAFDAKLAFAHPELFRIDSTFFDVDCDPYDFRSATKKQNEKYEQTLVAHEKFNRTATKTGVVLGIVFLIVTLGASIIVAIAN